MASSPIQTMKASADDEKRTDVSMKHSKLPGAISVGSLSDASDSNNSSGGEDNYTDHKQPGAVVLENKSKNGDKDASGKNDNYWHEPPPRILPPKGAQHGKYGVFYGGDWVDIEDCDQLFTASSIEHKCSGCVAHQPSLAGPCPRSRSRNVVRTNADGTYDVLIIGAGCIGAAIARELSKTQLKVLWVEAADDVSQGATKGNSGIVHAGYDDKPNTNRAKYCWKGNQMFAQLDKELRFGYQRNGSLVVAMNDKDREHLRELLERGETNGVKNLRIVDQKELRKMEPHINPKAIAALYSPDAGNVIPYVSTSP